MKIKIRNNTAIGLLEFYPDAKIPEETMTYICHKLHNIEFCIGYDLEQPSILVKMEGSIVSMMQLRKFILMNWPKALKE